MRRNEHRAVIPRGGRGRRSRVSWLLVCLVAGTLFAGAATGEAADPILPLAEVRPGMLGEARTVVQGSKIETFRVEIIDVISSMEGPGGVLILGRAGGPLMERTGGVAAGMSGSPVYVTGDDGVQRVIGAIALGAGDERNEIVGIRPIEPMLEANSGARAHELTRPASTAGPRRRASLVRDRRTARALEATRPERIGLYPLTQWSAQGISGPLLRRAARALPVAARRVTSGGTQASSEQEPLVPGAPLSYLFVAGDIAYGAVGTVTYVADPWIIGFGHSVLDAGRARFLMSGARVYDTVPAPLLGSSYKIAEPGVPQGMIVGDRADGVTGRLRPVQSITGLARARFPERGADSVVRAAIAPDVRSAPTMSGFLQGEPVFRATDGRAAGTLTLRVSVSGPDLATPFRYRNMYASPADIRFSGTEEVQSLVEALMANGVQPIRISRIDVNQVIESEVRAARIASVDTQGRAAGGRVTLVLRVEPWQRPARTLRLRVTLPLDVDRETPQLRVVPNAPGGFVGSGSIDETVNGGAVADGGAAPRRLAVRTTRTAQQSGGDGVESVISALESATQDRHDAVRLLSEFDDPYDPSAGVTVPVPYVIYAGEAETVVSFAR